MIAEAGKTHYRTIWLSDVHLGTRGCRADALRPAPCEGGATPAPAAR